MSWHIGVFQALVQSALAGAILTAVAAAAISFVKQPARKIRLIEFTLFGLCVVPLAALAPGLPRLSVLPAWTGSDVAEETFEQGESIPVEPTLPLPSTAVESKVAELAPLPIGPREHETAESLLPVAQSEPDDPIAASDLPQSEREIDLETAPAMATAPPDLPAASGGESTPNTPWNFRAWIVAAYLAGVAVMIAWSAVGWLAAARVLRSSRPASEQCQRILREIAGAGVERVRLIVSPRAKQPCAVAWRPTMIVLPSELCASASSQDLRWALAHEWSHVERGDIWTWAGSGVVRWFYFYQPLVWWLRRQLRLCQDFVADDRAARAGSANEDYAEFLTSYLAQAGRQQLAAGLGIGGHASELERRIVMLVEDHPPLESSSPRRWNFLAMPIAVLLIAAVAMLGERRASDGAEPQIKESQAKESAVGPQSEPAVPEALQAKEPAVGPQDEPVVAPAPKATPAPRPGKPRYGAEPAKTAKPTPSPAQPAIVAPVAGVAAQPKPRTIAPGDALTIEVNTNYLDDLLLPPKTTVTVEDDGTVPLGSKYGSPSLAGKALFEAAGELEKQISTQVKLTAGPDLQDQFELRPLAINVRISFANAVVRPSGAGVTSLPRVISPLDTNEAPKISFPANSQAIPTGLRDRGTLPRPYDPFAEEKSIEKRAPKTTPPSSETARELPGLVQLLEPLDTVEVLLALNENRVVGNSYSGNDPRLHISGTYPIEPDGNIALPHGYGRVNVKGLDEKQAGAALRNHLSGRIPILTALPTVRVVRRGRAVWPKGEEPAADYRVRPGDKLLIRTPYAPSFEHTVNSEGKLPWSLSLEKTETPVAGLTLAEAQEAIQKIAVQSIPIGGMGGGMASANKKEREPVPILVTIGGWREEADPEVVEQFEVSDQGRVERLENDIRELKDMVRKLKGARN